MMDARDNSKSSFRGGLERLLSLCRNWVSGLGLFLVALALLLLITFGLFTLTQGRTNPYLDIIGYMVLPTVFVAGLIIVPVGVLLERRRRRREEAGAAPRRARIDLNDARTRGAIAIFSGATFFVVLPVLAVTSYQGYVYTESTEFCAEVCHGVMEPQATAHATSPHARVSCAACHIGEGASWFVKSKLSGTRQVFAVWLDTFSRPIPPAITELRPARETCEECHWPAQFFGWQLMERMHYSPNEANTPRLVRMMVKTGGADESTGQFEGIHMHMMVRGRVQYVALDEHLQEIPWVRYERRDGTATIYRSDGKPSSEPRPEGIVRTVDCMDCHNRGAHHFRPPQRAVDEALAVGRIDASLPYVKRQAVAALVQGYESTEAARRGIEEALAGFYEREHAEVWARQEKQVRAAVDVVQALYERSFFPGMNVTWRTYPENVGHMYSAGCFRCHDGRHVDDAGNAITSDCTVCHEFLEPIAGRENAYDEGRFRHSMDLAGHRNLRCDQCHTGGKLLLCYECHASGQWMEQRGSRDFVPTGL